MFPKMGRSLQRGGSDLGFAQLVSGALIEELGQTHQAVKTAMRWTGASERSVKHWIAGAHGPSGEHLLSLMRHSDCVLGSCLVAAHRPDVILAFEITAVRGRLMEIIALIDGHSAQGTSLAPS
jgi:hypothetical protein